MTGQVKHAPAIAHESRNDGVRVAADALGHREAAAGQPLCHRLGLGLRSIQRRKLGHAARRVTDHQGFVPGRHDRLIDKAVLDQLADQAGPHSGWLGLAAPAIVQQLPGVAGRLLIQDEDEVPVATRLILDPRWKHQLEEGGTGIIAIACPSGLGDGTADEAIDQLALAGNKPGLGPRTVGQVEEAQGTLLVHGDLSAAPPFRIFHHRCPAPASLACLDGGIERQLGIQTLFAQRQMDGVRSLDGTVLVQLDELDIGEGVLPQRQIGLQDRLEQGRYRVPGC